MIVGIVVAAREAVVYVEVVGPRGDSDFIRVVIDTGFTGALVLPQETITALDLERTNDSLLRLGDGTVVEMQQYLAEIVWHGVRKPIIVTASRSESLLGMRLLEGSRVTMDVARQGEVLIQPLPEAPTF